MITNVPKEWLPPEKVRPFYSLRWQIELLFKQLKSVLRINHCATGKEPRLRCELLGKLIMAIMIHRIHACFNISMWNAKRHEISMEKLYKRIQERAFTLTTLLLISPKRARQYLASELDRLMNNCRKLKQKSRLSSLDALHVDNGYKVERFLWEGLT